MSTVRGAPGRCPTVVPTEEPAGCVNRPLPGTETPRDTAARLLRPIAEPMVREIDPDPMPGPDKHSLIRRLLLAIAVGFLKSSVRETRRIPDDVLVEVADSVIVETVDAIRGRSG